MVRQPFALEDTERDRAVVVLVDDELADVRIRRCVDRQDVAGSDADAEFDETVLKMRSTLASLGFELNA